MTASLVAKQKGHIMLRRYIKAMLIVISGLPFTVAANAADVNGSADYKDTPSEYKLGGFYMQAGAGVSFVSVERTKVYHVDTPYSGTVSVPYSGTVDVPYDATTAVNLPYSGTAHAYDSGIRIDDNWNNWTIDWSTFKVTYNGSGPSYPGAVREINSGYYVDSAGFHAITNAGIPTGARECTLTAPCYSLAGKGQNGDGSNILYVPVVKEAVTTGYLAKDGNGVKWIADASTLPNGTPTVACNNAVNNPCASLAKYKADVAYSGTVTGTAGAKGTVTGNYSGVATANYSGVTQAELKLKNKFALTGATFDTTLGYDVAASSGLFGGVYAAVGYDSASNGDMKTGFTYGGGVRAGINGPGNSKFFARVGYQGVHLGADDFSGDLAGILAGVGAEARFGKNWSLGASVDYINYGSLTDNNGNDVKVTETVGKGFIKYNF